MPCRSWLAGAVLIAVAACREPDPVAPPTDGLIEDEELAPGDPTCPGGGVRIRSGLDDGADGGVANDGVLQPGEVDDTLTRCDPVDETDVPDAPRWLSLEPPDGPAGDAVLDVHGGDGGRAGGGAGGTISLSFDQASARGHLAVFATGAPTAAPPLPPRPAIDLGPTPFEVTEDLTLVDLPFGAPHELGDVFFREQSTMLILEDGLGGTPITGLHVHPGVTLTLPPTPSGRILIFRNGVHLEGTLTVAGGGVRDIDLSCAAFHATADARVDLAAPDGTADAEGEEGGALQVTVGATGTAVPRPAGSLWMEGTVDVRGGSGRSGGDGGGLALRSPTDLVFTGTLLGTGGAALGDGVSGDAAGAGFEALAGLAYVHATVELAGGSGGAAGGLGGGVSIRGTRIDDRSTFVLDGGDAGDACPDQCAGGAGGALILQSLLGAVVHEGAVHARGGRGTGQAGRGGGGGRGGSFRVDTLDGDAQTTFVPGQRTEIAGELLLSGGEGSGAGGRGGSFEVGVAQPYEDDATVRLYGYALLDLHGGDAAGPSDGGDGGVLDVSLTGEDAAGGVVLAAGADLRGGVGRKGGAGGFVEVHATVVPGDDDPDRAVRLLGDLLLDGGSGRATGGTSGTVRVTAVHRVELLGDVDARAGSSPEGVGAEALRAWFDEPGFSLVSERAEVTVGGDVHVRGGDGRDGGGRGGFLFVQGVHVHLAGDLEALGGTSSEARGGDGGFLQLLSALPPTTVDGTIDVAAGDGASTPGTVGQVWIDGVGGHTDDAP